MPSKTEQPQQPGSSSVTPSSKRTRRVDSGGMRALQKSNRRLTLQSRDQHIYSEKTFRTLRPTAHRSTVKSYKRQGSKHEPRVYHQDTRYAPYKFIAPFTFPPLKDVESSWAIHLMCLKMSLPPRLPPSSMKSGSVGGGETETGLMGCTGSS